MDDLLDAVAETAELTADELLADLDLTGATHRPDARRAAALACLAARMRVLALREDHFGIEVGQLRTRQVVSALEPVRSLAAYRSVADWLDAEQLTPLVSDVWRLATTGLGYRPADPEAFCKRLEGRGLIEIEMVGGDYAAQTSPDFLWLITDEPRALTVDASWAPDFSTRDLDAALDIRHFAADTSDHARLYLPVRRLEGMTVERAAAGTNAADGTEAIADETELVDRLRLEFDNGLAVCFDAVDGPGPCLQLGDHGSPLDPDQPRTVPPVAPTVPADPQPTHRDGGRDDIPF
jgi:hypothetical protein